MDKIVYISAVGCSCCAKMDPVIDSIKGVEIVRINGVKEIKMIKRVYNEIQVPTIIVFKGEQEQGRFRGLASKEDILDLLK